MSTRPRKFQIGDCVKFASDAQVYKMHRHPMEVMNFLADLNNPRLVISDEKNVPPEVEQQYLISDVRDMFDAFGYRKRICKIIGIVDNMDGWVPDKSLELIFEGSE